MPFDPHSLMRLNNYGPDGGKALGYVDPVLAKGRWRTHYPLLQEFDPIMRDPPVKDSRVTAIDGADTQYDVMQGTVYQYMGMPSDVWRYNVLYRQNPAIKHIYENWEISKEHPGMLLRPHMKLQYDEWWRQGDMWPTKGFLKKFGGRFFDAPNGEQCLVKTWCAVKFSAIWSLWMWAFDMTHMTMPRTWPKRWFQLLRISYLPITAGAVWGASTCMMCSVRGKEDLYNYLFSGILYGAVFGLRLGAVRGFEAGLACLVLTFGWRISRDFEYAWRGPVHKWGTSVSNVATHYNIWDPDLGLRTKPTENKW